MVETAMSAPTVMASVPFWIPDSTAMVEASDFSSLRSLADARPMVSRTMFRITNTGPSVGKLVMNTVQFLASAPPIMRTKRTIAAREMMGAIRLVSSGALLVTNIPRPTGIAVMQNMMNPSFVTFTGGASEPIKCRTARAARIGTVMMERRLVTAVSEIDSGVFPPAILDRTLLVTPPGQSARMIRPTENSGDSPTARANARAMIGNKITWFKRPTVKALGNLKILEKSLHFRPSPSENMMNARTSGSAILMIIGVIRLSV